MADFAPTYMDTYDEDGPDVALGAITLSASTVTAVSAAGTVIGALGNKSARGTLSILDDSGRFAISGSNLVKGSVASVAGSYPVQVMEDSQYSMPNRRVTVFTITVT